MQERLERMIAAYEREAESGAERNCLLNQDMQDAWVAGAMMANVSDLLTLIYRAAENNEPALHVVKLLEARHQFSEEREAA